MSLRTICLYPHDLSFKWRECKRCWWLATRGLVSPSPRLPAIFAHIDKGMKRALSIELLRQIGVPVLAPFEPKKLISEPIPFEEHGCQIVVKGYADKVYELQDHTFAIIEAKTTVPGAERLTQYAPQAMCYTVPLERPACDVPRDVSVVGLACFDPSNGAFVTNGVVGAQKGEFVWIPLEIDRAGLYRIFTEIASCGGSDDMPEAGPACETCHHVAAVRRYEDDNSKRAQAVA